MPEQVQYRDLFCQAVKFTDGPDGFFVDGVIVAEEVDREGEIWDYASSKDGIISWSNELASKSGGENRGNVRSMHGGEKRAAGHIVDLVADDAAKLFRARVLVDDPIDIKKCKTKTYTGFSIKAPYAERWSTLRNPRFIRWTSGKPVEVSLVDLPMIYSAVIANKMADG